MTITSFPCVLNNCKGTINCALTENSKALIDYDDWVHLMLRIFKCGDCQKHVWSHEREIHEQTNCNTRTEQVFAALTFEQIFSRFVLNDTEPVTFDINEDPAPESEESDSSDNDFDGQIVMGNNGADLEEEEVLGVDESDDPQMSGDSPIHIPNSSDDEEDIPKTPLTKTGDNPLSQMFETPSRSLPIPLINDAIFDEIITDDEANENIDNSDERAIIGATNSSDTSLENDEKIKTFDLEQLIKDKDEIIFSVPIPPSDYFNTWLAERDYEMLPQRDVKSLGESLYNMREWKHEAARIKAAGDDKEKDLNKKCELLEEQLKVKDNRCSDLVKEIEKLKTENTALNKSVDTLKASKSKTASATTSYPTPKIDPRIAHREGAKQSKQKAQEVAPKIMKPIKTPLTTKEPSATPFRELLKQVIKTPVAPPTKGVFECKSSVTAPSSSTPSLVESIKSSATKSKSKPPQKNTKSSVSFVEPSTPILPPEAHFSGASIAKFAKTSGRQTPQSTQKRTQRPTPAEDEQQYKKKKGKHDSFEDSTGKKSSKEDKYHRR